jgi:hypothetical protein
LVAQLLNRWELKRDGAALAVAEPVGESGGQMLLLNR